MKQHSRPVIIKNNQAKTLEKISLNSTSYNEDWIQKICFENPNLLPLEELEPTFEGMIPICRELSTDSGSIDLIFINEYGFITIGECKLWRNPEARRKVVGQVLDYAKDLAKWDYEKFERECLKAGKCSEKNLLEIVQKYYPDTDEASFIDSIQNNLKKGRFLLVIIGDGIRENMEELANYIHRNANLNFTLGLIEIPVYKNPDEDELIITPRILAKTKEVERIIYRISETNEDVQQAESKEEVSQTISETVFFERLEKVIGKEKIKELKSFLESLSSDLNMITKLGRGKRLSLNLKSGDDVYNFASIQEDGDVMFYGIVYKTGEIGDKNIGINYLKELASITKGKVETKYKEWSWSVKRNGKYINIVEYLWIKDEWVKLIEETMNKINETEEK